MRASIPEDLVKIRCRLSVCFDDQEYALRKRRKSFLRCTLILIEETLGRFAICPIFTSCIDRRQRLFSERDAYLLDAVIQAAISQINLGKFNQCPIRFVYFLVIFKVYDFLFILDCSEQSIVYSTSWKLVGDR